MRKKLGYLAAAVTLAGVLLVPFDASGSTPGTQISCLHYVVRTSSATISSTSWENVPGMALSSTLAQNFAVQVSGSFSGGAVRLRLADSNVGGTQILAPGVTAPPTGSGLPRAFSFTWVGTDPAQHSHLFKLQWQLIASGPASMRSGAMTVIYEGTPTLSTC